MLRSGTASPEIHDAAKDFQAAFIVANRDTMRALCRSYVYQGRAESRI